MNTFIKRYLNFFSLIYKNDSEELRKKKILNIFLLGIEFIAVLVSLIYFSFLIAGSPIEGFENTIEILLLSILAAIGGVISLLINNYISSKIANINFLGLITILIYIADSPYELVLGRSLMLLVLPIIMAGFLFKPYASYIMSIIIVLVNLLICVINGFFPNLISLVIYVLIAFITWFSAINFEQSIEKYREAYRRERFYKDLIVHDTSNILQSILMSLEIFEQKLKISENSNEVQFLRMTKTQLDRGVNLIKNVKNIKVSSESKMILKKVDFRKVLENALEKIISEAKGKEFKFQIETSTQNYTVMADKFLLNIFENILYNSIIHNDNPIVEVLIKITKIQENKYQFLKAEFIDNGIGIQDSRKEDIFMRDIDRDKSLSGLGVGLSFIKNILDKYKAKIWVENNIPDDHTKGSNFILLFPVVA